MIKNFLDKEGKRKDGIGDSTNDLAAIIGEMGSKITTLTNSVHDLAELLDKAIEDSEN